MTLKSLLILLPFLSAICWSATYVLNSEILKTVSLPTSLVMVNGVCALCGVLFAVLFRDKIDFSPYFLHEKRMLFWAAPVVAGLGSIVLQLSLREVNATYTVLIESAYIFFTPLFAYLFFGYRQWNTSILWGGAFIFTGIAIIVLDKTKQVPPTGV